jgi:hypothetical protein
VDEAVELGLRRHPNMSDNRTPNSVDVHSSYGTNEYIQQAATVCSPRKTRISRNDPYGSGRRRCTTSRTIRATAVSEWCSACSPGCGGCHQVTASSPRNATRVHRGRWAAN